MSVYESVSIEDAHYPTTLALIPNPPKKLWYRGKLSALEHRAVAVVGSRKSSEYGRWAAFTIAKRLSQYDVCVVSGMADGIDTWAHKGCLSEKAPTIAVFGCGLDICFPKSNMGLMEKIIENGLVISEYPVGTRPAKYTFPQRNRIISGLAVTTIIVEAGVSSGSLITAEHALEQGREVYVVPGNINRSSSVGCNKLISEGARPIVFIDDVLTGLGIKTVHAEFFSNSYTRAEQRVLAAILKNGEISFTSLAAELSMSIGDLISNVTILEMKGAIHTAAGKAFPADFH
jgi:DNA processing protein